MRKSYKLKQALSCDDKVLAKAGAPVPLTRAQFEALHAQGLIDKPADPADAWPEPKAKGGTSARSGPPAAKPEG